MRLLEFLLLLVEPGETGFEFRAALVEVFVFGVELGAAAVELFELLVELLALLVEIGSALFEKIFEFGELAPPDFEIVTLGLHVDRLLREQRDVFLLLVLPVLERRKLALQLLHEANDLLGLGRRGWIRLTKLLFSVLVHRNHISLWTPVL